MSSSGVARSDAATASDQGVAHTSALRSLTGWVVAILGYLYYATPLIAWAMVGQPVPPWLVVVTVVPGLLGLIALRWRARYPVVVAAVSAALWAFSPGVIGVVAVAQANLARRAASRTGLIVGMAVAMLTCRAAGMVLEAGDDLPRTATWVEGTLSVVAVVIATLTGLMIAARAQAMVSHEDAVQARAEAERARMNEVRMAERERIAREMHDVVAHRISLVALHSGALAYRTNLDAEQTREIAELIKSNAQASLTELRAMLTELRGPDLPPEAPQPSLDQLPALIGDATDAGQRIVLNQSGETHAVPERVSRQAFRIIQECLTNARKHAPGAPVTVDVARTESALTVTVSNPLSDLAPRDLSGSGLGLVGIRERVELTGGSVSSGVNDGRFVVRAVMPTQKEADA